MKKIPTRFIVTNYCYNNSDNNTDNRKELHLDLLTTFYINENNEKYKCILRDFWINLNIKLNDYVNVFDAKIESNKNAANTLIIDNNDGLIIIRPDVLIPITTLMMATYCMRKAWLSKMFQIFGEPSKALLIGTIVHEIFQECIQNQLLDVEQINRFTNNSIISKYTLELYDLNITREDLLKDIRPYIDSISKWLKIYTDNDSSKEKLLNEEKLFTIQRLHDVENNIWSTKYGFIGKIDLSIEAIIEDKFTKAKYSNLIPLELKTGKHTFSSSHTGQVILYSIIMGDKYVNYKSFGGYLLYLKDNPHTQCISTNRHAIRDLIILRNQFVRYFDKLGFIDEVNYKNVIMKGPPALNSSYACERCEHNLDCSLIYRCFDQNLYDYDQKNSSHISSMITSHLRAKDMEFFQKWCELLEIERQHCMASEEFVDFWNHRSEDCERVGLGLSRMKIKNKNNGIVVFHRHPKQSMLPKKFFQLNNDLKINPTLLEERSVIISEELMNPTKTIEIYGNFCRKLCLTVGYIESFSDDLEEISIRLEKDICQLNPQTIYRLDFLKNISNRAMMINFSNLLRLMYGDEDKRAKELREIIIHGHVPKSNYNGYKFGTYNQLFNCEILSKLNIQQKRCILGILKTKCSLIFGSPGSGKTQTIVALIQILVKHGYSVLVTSYTHAAVDNILLKLVQFNDEYNQNVDFLRLGSVKRINQKLLKFSDYERTKEYLETENINALHKLYSTIPVVSATCLGIFNHPLFRKRKFDYCIIDEASQVFLCTSLGPLFNCHNFILVGDQKQLPPVVQSHYARHNGLDESLFSRLLNTTNNQNIGEFDDDYIENNFDKDNKNNAMTIKIFPLFIQYRMNKIIMDIANRLTYDNKLKCANEQIEQISLMDYLSTSIIDQKILEQYRQTYLSKIISPNLNDSVVFIDTSGLEMAYEIYDNDGDNPSQQPKSFDSKQNSLKINDKCSYVINLFEAKLITIIVQKLLLIYGSKNDNGNGKNFNINNIGIISPFRKQVNKIRELFDNEIVEPNDNEKCLEINTVDQYQGRDKDVIIYSCVKSFQTDTLLINNSNDDDKNSQKSMIIDSELLKDERRLNVALTRSKRKLIIIGNCQTLKRYLPFRSLFNVLNTEQYVRLIEFNDNLNVI